VVAACREAFPAVVAGRVRLRRLACPARKRLVKAEGRKASGA